MRSIVSHIIISGVSTRADGSLGVRFSTPELTSAEKVAFMDLVQKNCIVRIEPLEDMEAPIEVKAEINTKSPSQRLRGVLYAIWVKKGSEGDFEAYYRRRFEGAYQKMRDELDALNDA